MSSQLNTVCPKILLGPTIDPETQTNVIEDRMKYKERGDWSFNNLIAFCSQIHVQIIDPISISTITTLYGHKSITTCVKWCPLSIKNGMERGNTNILASADESGIIIIWDIRLSKPIHVLDTGKNTGVISMKWLNEQQKYLLVLSASATLVCFNLLNQSRVWSKSFSEPIISFTINPFNKNMAAVASNTGRIYLISDLNVNSLPEKVEQKMKVGEVKDSNGNMVSNLKDIEFSPHNRDQLYLITRRETLFGKSFHGAKSDFRNIFLFEEYPNKMFSVHDDGRAGIWTIDESGKHVENTMCDSVRGNKHGGERPGLLHSAVFSERYPNMLVSSSADGKVWIWNMIQGDNGNEWILNGLLESISSQITSFQNSPFGPFVSIGTNSGHIQIFNLLNSNLEGRYEINIGLPTKGVRWITQDRIIAFTVKTISKQLYENRIMILYLKNGKVSQIRKDRKQESTYIKAVRVSSSSLAVIIFAGRPIEIWDLKSMSLQRIVSFYDVTSLEFRIPSLKDRDFINFTTLDGTHYIYKCEKGDIIQEKVKPKMFNSSQPTAIVWSQDLVIVGDQSGVITTMEYDKKRSRTLNTGRGSIKKVRLSPDNSFLFILYSNGSFSIFDMENLTLISQSPSHIKATSIDWISGNYPVVGVRSGNLFIYDIGLITCNSNIIFRQLSEPMKSASCLPKDQSLVLRSLLDHEIIQREDMSNEKHRNEFGELYNEKIINESFIHQVKLHYELLTDDIYKELSNKSTPISQRALLTSKFFGDKVSYRFWILAQRFLEKYKNGIPNDELVPEEKFEKIEKKVDNEKEKNPLPPIFDLLREDSTVQKDEVSRLKIMDDSLRLNQNKESSGLISGLASSEVLVNKKDEAVNLLLETPTNHKDLFKNYLHACVISASNSREHYVNTIQVVATSLLSLKSEEEFDMGIELLCLIGEGYKACRVLQDFDQWDKAARIAKCILPTDKRRLVLVRWANELNATDQKMESAGVYLSLGLFVDVLDVLHQSKLDDIATLFIKACEEMKVPMIGKEKFSSDQDRSEERFKKLKEEIFTSYAQHLEKIGNKILSNDFKPMIEK